MTRRKDYVPKAHGRPKNAPADATKPHSIRLTEKERRYLDLLGGASFVRRQIDAHTELLEIILSQHQTIEKLKKVEMVALPVRDPMKLERSIAADLATA